MHSGDNSTNFFQPPALGGPFSLVFPPLFMKNLDGNLSIVYYFTMAKYVVKISDHKSCFRIVIPRKLIQEIHWEKGTYVVIEEFSPYGIKIRRLFDDEKLEG